MKHFCCFFFTLLFIQFLSAQKKPLDHSVYDAWQHVGEKMISHNGNWVVYTIEPQEGDGVLHVRGIKEDSETRIPRGYMAGLTADSRFLVCRLRAPWKEIRQAKIKKKKPEEYPLDSLLILELATGREQRFADVKNYRLPESGSGSIAFTQEKRAAAGVAVNRKADSLQHVVDSLQQRLAETGGKKKKNRKTETSQANSGSTGFPAPENERAGAVPRLVFVDLSHGRTEFWDHVADYTFSKEGNHLLIKLKPSGSDSIRVLISQLPDGKSTSIVRQKGDVKNMAISGNGSQVAFVADFEKKRTDGLRFYQLYLFQSGEDTAINVADRYAVGMPLGQTVSEHAPLRFSDNGQRLFFSTAPNPLPQDTTLPEIDVARLDIWHYNDDYLQTVQNLPNRLRAAQQQSYLAVVSMQDRRIVSLACPEIPVVMTNSAGDGKYFTGLSDLGKRISAQWEGFTRRDVFAIDVETGEQILLKKDLHGNVYTGASGKAIAWFDRDDQEYFAWDGERVKKISTVPSPRWGNEENDLPGAANNYGIMGWHEQDAALYVYDRFDVWKLSLAGEMPSLNITGGEGRREKRVFRYQVTDTAKRFFVSTDTLVFRTTNDETKQQGFVYLAMAGRNQSELIAEGNYSYSDLKKAAGNHRAFVFTRENFTEPPDLFYLGGPGEAKINGHGNLPVKQLTRINLQQADYNWGRAELFRWKAYDGRDAAGIVYKPEDFDPKKKYPVIIYFYERLSQTLFDYKEPAPIRSAVNIPFFVSRGYILFLPDIRYETGYPGRSAFNYVVSGTRALAKQGYIDTTRMALQGHSWGGYQAAQLATMTSLYKAIWAGAPVSNMTSAYGGIRYESGLSRQFQYEQSQSRIGGTLWEKLPLYLENSPLFHLEKVTAPMVILHNDADGAVPWTQGIELFTALRRLGKKTWLLNYNGQGHGLTQRQDMRDYHIRMQQFFDWILKGEPPARWITDGVPAVDKGRDRGY